MIRVHVIRQAAPPLCPTRLSTVKEARGAPGVAVAGIDAVRCSRALPAVHVGRLIHHATIPARRLAEVPALPVQRRRRFLVENDVRWPPARSVRFDILMYAAGIRRQ